ncbi:hypothetical protein DFJ74DRAFT_765241 [Hyaloraphidium curvatum]|nr:hypothetical protein DFJ74DRAFT_765241 [Hyaloraphidium curvatum]
MRFIAALFCLVLPLAAAQAQGPRCVCPPEMTLLSAEQNSRPSQCTCPAVPTTKLCYSLSGTDCGDTLTWVKLAWFLPDLPTDCGASCLISSDEVGTVKFTLPPGFKSTDQLCFTVKGWYTKSSLAAGPTSRNQIQSNGVGTCNNAAGIRVLRTYTGCSAPTTAFNVFGDFGGANVADGHNGQPLDTSAVTLGTVMQASQAIDIVAIRIYGTGSSFVGKTVYGQIWTDPSAPARSTGPITVGSGWTEYPITSIRIAAGGQFIASYLANTGPTSPTYYVFKHDVFAGGVTYGSGDVVATAGRYTYSSAPSYPTDQFLNSFYYVDIVYKCAGV